MGAKPPLTQLLTPGQFRRMEKMFRRQFELGLETADRAGEVAPALCSADCRPAFCALVQAGPEGAVERRLNQNAQRNLAQGRNRGLEGGRLLTRGEGGLRPENNRDGPHLETRKVSGGVNIRRSDRNRRNNYRRYTRPSSSSRRDSGSSKSGGVTISSF